jgi:hypothetical protein
VVVPAAQTSPAAIAGIAPSYGPKEVSAVSNAAEIVRRIWLPELYAGYARRCSLLRWRHYVSAYQQQQLGVHRGPCGVIRIDVETGGQTGYVDLPSPRGHANAPASGVTK